MMDSLKSRLLFDFFYYTHLVFGYYLLRILKLIILNIIIQLMGYLFFESFGARLEMCLGYHFVF